MEQSRSSGRASRSAVLLSTLLATALVMVACQEASVDTTTTQGGTETTQDEATDTTQAGSETTQGGATETTADSGASEDDLIRATFRTNWIADGTDSTIGHLGLDKGFFQDQGLLVQIQLGRGSLEAVQLASAGSIDFGSAEGATVIQAITQGAPIKVVAATSAAGPSGILCMEEAGVTEPADLEGKTVGIPTESSVFQMWPAFVNAAGIDGDAVTVTNIQSSALITTMTQGAVDCVGLWPASDALALEKEGIATTYLLYSDYGVVLHGPGIIANLSVIEEKPDLVRSFVAAWVESLEYTAEHPDEAAAAVAKYYPDDIADVDFQATDIALFLDKKDTPETEGQQWGWMSEQDWEITQNLLVEYGDLESTVPVDQIFTNEFLPGA